MKAMVMSALGAANLALCDVQEPTPNSGEVLVRLRAAAISFRDLLVLEGKYGSRHGSGEVAAVGSGVTEWKIGDWVDRSTAWQQSTVCSRTPRECSSTQSTRAAAMRFCRCRRP